MALLAAAILPMVFGFTRKIPVPDAIVKEMAATPPGKVTVVDLNAILDPGGRFQTVVDGGTVRWADGIHVTRAGGQWAEQFVLPTVAQLGLDARAAGGG